MKEKKKTIPHNLISAYTYLLPPVLVNHFYHPIYSHPRIPPTHRTTQRYIYSHTLDVQCALVRVYNTPGVEEAFRISSSHGRTRIKKEKKRQKTRILGYLRIVPRTIVRYGEPISDKRDSVRMDYFPFGCKEIEIKKSTYVNCPDSILFSQRW